MISPQHQVRYTHAEGQSTFKPASCHFTIFLTSFSETLVNSLQLPLPTNEPKNTSLQKNEINLERLAQAILETKE